MLTAQERLSLRHRNLIVATDPAINGDLVCMELLDPFNFNIQLIMVLLWGAASSLVIANNHYAKKRANDRWALHH